MAMARSAGGNDFERLDERVRSALLDNHPGILHELGGGTGEELTPERLRAIRQPTTLFLGNASSRFLHVAAERLMAIKPEIRFVRIPDEGHMMVVTQPRRFAETVTKALAGS
jgi:pimeloyl-ACP methyl ester carboxylesterase